MLYAQAYSNTPGLAVSASIDESECTGGVEHLFQFGFNDVNDGRGFLAARVFDVYVAGRGRRVAGPFTSRCRRRVPDRIEAATEPPVGGQPRT